MIDLLKDLNDRQRQAVTAPLGPVLVLAGAGSGKTRALSYRIAYLIENKMFKPQDLLALTFTNKAAGEMRARIDRILNVEYGISNRNSTFHIPHSKLTMGTFHSVCARILRAEIENLSPSPNPSHEGRGNKKEYSSPLSGGGKVGGYTRNFVIYDTDDSERVLKQILIELGLEERFRPQVFAYYISQAKSRLVTPADLDLDNSYFAETLNQVYELYERRLRDSNAADFDDLLKLVCELLMAEPKVLARYQNRFKYILVDEYQDTNHAQYVLLKLLAERHQNIFVVGDDAQSIYGFRGANLQNILDFGKDYPEAKIVMLDQNYRSTQAVLDVAHEVIALNPFQYEKKLWTEQTTGAKVNLYEAGDEMDEAEFAIRQILRIQNTEYRIKGKDSISYTPILDQFEKFKRHASFGIRNSEFSIPDNLNEIVILYRTHAQSRPFEELLLGSGIPYQIVGGIKFYERKEIKDALSYLRLVVNPRDLVSLSRVINEPVRGIGPVAFKTISAGLAKYDYSYERLRLNLDKLELSPKARAGAEDFFSLYSPLEGGGKVGVKNILDLMEFILTRSGYKDKLLDGSEEGRTRWENIEELWNAAAKYKHQPWPEGLAAFLEEVALMTDLDKMEEQANKLTLMTLHSAKGLEFETVFLVGLEEGLLPHSRSLLNPAELAEEIRLAYVGITRAKENLYLSYARQRQSYGELKRCMPSRILKAIPKRLLHKLN